MRVIKGGQCFRENCEGTMIFDNGFYSCSHCGIMSTIDTYVRWYEADGTNNPDPEDCYEGVPGYEEVYDGEGDYVFCPACCIRNYYTPLKLYQDIYICPRCELEMSKQEFDAYAGAD